MAQRNAFVAITIAARDLASATILGVEQSVTRLRQSIFSMKTVMDAIAIGIFVHLIEHFFELGSEAEKTEQKFTAVFGNMSKDVDKFLKEWGVLGGLSEDEGRKLISTTGLIAQGLGFSREQSAKFSEAVVKLSMDIASFNNAPTENVILAVNTALTGIVRPLKQFGIVIGQNEIAQRAMTEAHKDNIKQVTAHEKALAALEVITEHAGVANGTLLRSQEAMANQARVLHGEMTTIKETFGDLLVSAFRVSGGFGDMKKSLADFDTYLEDNKSQISAWGAAVIEMVKLVVNVFASLVKGSFDFGVIIGQTLVGIWEISKVDLTKKGAIDEIKALWNQTVDVTKEAKDDMVAQADSVGQSFANLAVAVEKAQKMIKGGIGSGPAMIIPKETKLNVPLPDTTKKDVEALVKLANDLNKAYDLGVINMEQYRQKALALVPQFEALRKRAGDNIDEIDMLAKAYENLNKGVALGPAKFQIAALELETKRLVQGMKDGAIQVPEFVDKWELIRPMLMKLRDSGSLVESQLVIVNQLLKDLEGEAFKIASVPPLNVVDQRTIPFLQKVSNELRKLLGVQEDGFTSAARIGMQFAHDFGNAIESAMQAWVSGSKSAAEAFKDSMLGAVAMVARATAELFVGKALGALAEGGLGNPAAWASASKFFAGAAVLFALAGTLGGLGAGGGGGGAASASSQTSNLSGNKGDATIVFQGGQFLDMSDPRQEAAFAAAIESLTGRRVIIQKTTSVK